MITSPLVDSGAARGVSWRYLIKRLISRFKQGHSMLSMITLAIAPTMWLIPGACDIRDDGPLADVHRIVFVGDSITYSGQFIEYVEAWAKVTQPRRRCEFLNLGLPSETVSGLSEPGHADGAFPRPDLHERFVRILERTKPDLVVACYGMNDGIYYPLANSRFEKYQAGINWLRDQARGVGAQVTACHASGVRPDPDPIKDAPCGPRGIPPAF